MKQKYKAVMIIGLSVIFYLSFLSLIPDKTFISITTCAIVSALLTLFLIYTYIIRQVERLNHKVNNIAMNDLLSDRIKIKVNDEVTAIANNINTILQKSQDHQDKLENISRKNEQRLQDKNIELEQEISAKSRSKKMMFDAEYFMQLGKIDELTSLPNSIQFNEILHKAILHAKRRHQVLAVLLVNLDLFKLVQDTFGQENSNLILKEISKRLQNVLRKEDVLAKLDGDEFIVLLNDISKAKFASMVAEKILNICSQLLKLDSHEFTITASIGISIYPNDGQSLEEMLENADRALFQAKQSGGNTYQFHAEEIHLEAVEYVQLESALRKAIHNNELTLIIGPFRVNTE